MRSRKKSLNAEKPRILTVSPRAAPSPALSVMPGTFCSLFVPRCRLLFHQFLTDDRDGLRGVLHIRGQFVTQKGMHSVHRDLLQRAIGEIGRGSA